MINRSIAAEEQYGNAKASLRESPILYRIFKRFETHRVDKVSQVINSRKLRVLEIGCGDGNFLYKNRAKWKKITGVDVVSEQIKKAKKRNYQSPAEFLPNDFGIEPMSFRSSSFDCIVSISTIQYILDLDLFCSEAARVLRKNGSFIIEVPNCAVFWKRMAFLFGKFPTTTEYTNKWNGGVLHYFTEENLCSFLEEKGFLIEQVTCSGVFASFRSLWPGFLGADLVIVARKI